MVGAYGFEPGARYTGTMVLERLAGGVIISGSLSQGGEILSEFSFTDEGNEINNIGVSAFHVNGKMFGYS